MKILVTGGAGFIGSHIVDALVEKKHQVIIIDNLSTGKKENINPKAKFAPLDLSHFQKIQKFLQKEKPQVIFHLAAQMDVRKSVADPMFDAKTNILGSINLIKAAQENKVKKIIFSSTGGATYGDTEQRPTSETWREVPLSPYGIAKMTVDRFLEYCRLVQGLNYTSLRYANVYGPRQNPQGEAGVVAIFIGKMLNGNQPIINGDGKQTRDYVFVEDVVRANLAALKNFKKTGIYNVGTAKETSVNDLFWEINKYFGNTFKEVHGPAKPGEQKTSCLSYAKIQKEFGWKPRYNLSQGIKKTLEWFKNNNFSQRLSSSKIRKK